MPGSNKDQLMTFLRRSTIKLDNTYSSRMAISWGFSLKQIWTKTTSLPLMSWDISFKN